MVRRFVVTLPSEEYRRLRELAAREERIVEQQASYLLRQVLQFSQVPAGSRPAEAEGAISAR